MRQMVFANVFVEGWIINPYVYGFFDQPFLVVLLSPHHTEVVNCGVMTCDVVMVKDRGGGFQMLFKPFTKGSG